MSFASASSAIAEKSTKATRAPQTAARAEAARTLPPDLPRILRLPAVEVMTGCKKTFIYEAMRRGQFPRPVPIGNRARGWLAPEVMAWIEDRAAMRT